MTEPRRPLPFSDHHPLDGAPLHERLRDGVKVYTALAAELAASPDPQDAADVDGAGRIAWILGEAADKIEQSSAARRAFLERAIVHPGPVEPVDPVWDFRTAEDLECQVIDRLDREMRLEREVWAMRQLADEKIGRDADLARGAIEVVRDMVAMFEERIVGLEREIRSLRTFDRSDLL